MPGNSVHLRHITVADGTIMQKKKQDGYFLARPVDLGQRGRWYRRRFSHEGSRPGAKMNQSGKTIEGDNSTFHRLFVNRADSDAK